MRAFSFCVVVVAAVVVVGAAGCSPCDDFGGDTDGDGVCDDVDNCVGVENADQADADDDGFGTACDNFVACPIGDQDGDGVCDDVDNCKGVKNVDQADVDEDGVGDVCAAEVCNGFDDDGDGVADNGVADQDGDGVCDFIDSCLRIANTDQRDTDGDGIGDACDVEVCDGKDNDGDGAIDDGLFDSDGDGVCDLVDVCPGFFDGGDGDGDGVVACADRCPLDPENDFDFDGVCGDVDNCPTAHNIDQDPRACLPELCNGVDDNANGVVDEGAGDEDGDGLCDDVDPCLGSVVNDDDGDGLCGDADNCPDDANLAQADANADGRGDACDAPPVVGCGPPAEVVDALLPAHLEVRGLAVFGDVVYLATSGASRSLPNRLVAIGPDGRLQWSVFAGSEVDALAVSDDGAVAYVATDGSGTVRPVDLVGRRACADFVVSSLGQANVIDLAVLPASHAVVVSAVFRGERVGASVQVFDDGLARGRGTADRSGAPLVAAFGDGVVVGVDPVEGDIVRFVVDDEGVREVQRVVGENVGAIDVVAGADGRVYTSSGAVIVPATLQRVGVLGRGGPVAVDVARDAAFVVGVAGIDVFDLAQLRIVRTLPRPAGVAINGNSRIARLGASSLVIAGNDGVAILDVD